MKIFYRLGGRIFVTFAVALMLLSLVFAGLASHFGARMVIDSSSNELRVLTVVVSQLIQKQFSSLENNLSLIQEDAIVATTLEYRGRNNAELNRYLVEQRAKYQIFEDLMVYDRGGRCVGTTDPEWYKIDGKGTDFFTDGLEEFNFPPIYGTDSAGKVQLVSAPIVNVDDDVIGVLVGIIRLNAVYDLMEQKIGLSENRDAFLLDENLRFITPGKGGPQELVESHLADTALKEHLHEESWVGDYLNYDGVKVQATVLKIPGYSWYVVVERRYEGVVQQVTAINRVIMAVTLLLMIIFVVASLVLSRSITLPLMQLVAATRTIGRGDFSQPVAVSRQYEEVEFLATEFERMRRRVAMSQGRLKERLEESESLRIESERLAGIGTLASTLAHEIRNPLNAMSLLVSRLRGALDDLSRKRVVDDVFGEISRLDRLVNSILDYARPINLNLAPVDLGVVIASTLEVYGSLFEQSNIELKIEAAETPCVSNFDSDKVKQCLINSYQNAIEAMPHGGKILVSWKRLRQDIILEIKDQGEGIAEDIQKKLFSPFFSTKQRGNGLGLSHIQKIVYAHGGQVEIESMPKGGDNEAFVTTLRMVFPG